MSKYELLIVEDDPFALDALAMCCAKGWGIFVRGTYSFDSLSELVEDKREGDSIARKAVLVSSDSPENVRFALAWSAENAPDLLMVILLRRPTAENVGAALSPRTRGIVSKCETGVAIGEIVNRCAGGEALVTPSIARHLFALRDVPESFKPNIVSVESPLKAMSNKLAQTMRMYCLWGMSAEEVAHCLGVSPNTVASRLRAGYLALGVSGRQEALRILARSLK